MKSWCDLSWSEKCKIKDGDVNEYKYSTGCTFQVKTEVEDGRRRREEKMGGGSECPNA